MTANTSQVDRCIFTIGHSNQPLDNFLNLLKAWRIEVLVDVRSYPHSKHAPHFDSQTLKDAIATAGIKYLFLGKELGGRPTGEEFYDAAGHVLYSRVAESPLFLDGISRLEGGLRKYRVAIMCSEENPAACHRRLLIGRVLAARGIPVCHIRTNNKVQTEAELTADEDNPSVSSNQPALFEVPQSAPWKSIRSVLRREKLQTSLRR